MKKKKKNSKAKPQAENAACKECSEPVASCMCWDNRGPSTKTYRCLIRQEQWSYETDRDIIKSPTGVVLEIAAHDSAYENHPKRDIVQKTIERSWDAPIEPAGPNRNWGIVYCTREEMEAWRDCAEAEAAHRRSVGLSAANYSFLKRRAS